MKYLSQGLHSKKEVNLLLELTKIKSESIISAIVDHLCLNFSISDAATLNDCKQGNLTHAINALNAVSCIVEKINELKFICVRSYERDCK